VYEQRVDPQPLEDDSDLLLTEFSVKGKYLRAACANITGHNRNRHDLLRSWILEHLDGLKTPKQWFFVLRFLRITLICELNAEKREIYKNTTIEWLSQIVGVLPWDSNAVVRELYGLTHSTYSPEIFRKFIEKNPRIGWLVRTPQEDTEFHELPSRIIEIVRWHDFYSRHLVCRIVEINSTQILSNFVLASNVFEVLREHDNLITKPVEYALAIIEPMSPLFVIGAKLVKMLIRRSSAVATAVHSVIRKLPECGSWVDLSASIIKALSKDIAGSLPQGDDHRSFVVMTDLFRMRPCLKFARVLATELIRCARTFDSNTFTFAFVDYGFIFALVVVAKVFNAMESSDDRAHFFDRVNEVSSQILKSRLRALVKLTQDRIDEAFLSALAETNDDNYLEIQINQLQNLGIAPKSITSIHKSL
jgi:hypothetical protein